MKLSKILPIYDITKNGIIVGDTKGALTLCMEIKLPVIYTLGDDGYEQFIERYRDFLDLLGEGIVVHKQDIFHREYFSVVNENTKMDSDFIDRSYITHFNERPYLNCVSYMYITKFDESEATTTQLFSNSSVGINEEQFISNILNATEILKDYIQFRVIDRDELLSAKSPILRYYNFSNADMEEIKDVSFENNSLYVGQKKVNIYSIEETSQFPTDNVNYNKIFNGVAVSNMFDFSYKLEVPHVCNQYIYIPNQRNLAVKLDKHQSKLRGYSIKGSNDDALSDIVTFKEKMQTLRCNGTYYHFNIMCFDDTDDNITKRINIAFASSGFSKKENTLSRKDLFLSGIPGNAVRLVMEKDYLMSLLIDLESAAFSIWEHNYSDGLTATTTGVRLCDRIYGIPFQVDLFDEPKKKGWINNQNAIVLAGAGSGKSFFTNLVNLNLYRQGAHIFIIDASYSYRLQTALHDGVYLTFDNENKITFNPFYLDWLHDAKELFVLNDSNTERERKKTLELYANYLEDKIATLSGLLVTMTKNTDEVLTKFESNIYRELIYEYFKYTCLNDRSEYAKFDDFFDFAQENLPEILRKNGIESNFDVKAFLFILKQFRTGNSLGYLLNSVDEKIKNLQHQRFVVIDVSRIRSNPTLFSIVSTLAMDLYNQKVAKLPLEVKKILCIDEAWQAISSPEMATFMKAQVKIIRKYGGQTIFISQELEDFISSEIVKESIINNSAIKIFADMKDFAQKFTPIKKALSISDNNEKKILSLNKNKRPNSTYKEVCICWQEHGQVYAVEVPTELKAIFETDAKEVGKILPQFKEYGIELTAINYANR